MADILFYSGLVMFVFFTFLTLFLAFKLKVVDAIKFVLKPESYRSKERNKITRKKALDVKKKNAKEIKARSKVLHTSEIDMTEVLGEVFEKTEIINDGKSEFISGQSDNEEDNATEVLEMAQNYATALLESSGTEFLDEEDDPMYQLD